MAPNSATYPATPYTVSPGSCLATKKNTHDNGTITYSLPMRFVAKIEN